MKLYHGSNTLVESIDLAKCHKYKDFGQGFYVTSIKQQASEWAKKVALRWGGVPIVNVYDFDENAFSKLNTISFETPDAKWGEFVINNRSREFTDNSNILSNQDNKYDIVHGLVANDDIAGTLEAFLNGLIPMNLLGQVLEYKKLNDQYSFHTQKALKYLQFVTSEVTGR